MSQSGERRGREAALDETEIGVGAEEKAGR